MLVCVSPVRKSNTTFVQMTGAKITWNQNLTPSDISTEQKAWIFFILYGSTGWFVSDLIANLMNFCKSPKFLDTQNIALTTLNFNKSVLEKCLLKIQIANSEDTDQTAPLRAVCIVCSDLSVPKLRIIIVTLQSMFFSKRSWALSTLQGSRL